MVLTWLLNLDFGAGGAAVEGLAMSVVLSCSPVLSIAAASSPVLSLTAENEPAMSPSASIVPL